MATNPTHYGNPSTGCESDEVAVRVSGLSGDFCSPKCDSQGTCPSDVPKGDTANPECALRTTTGDKYCGLICQADSDCGAIPALVNGSSYRKSAVHERYLSQIHALRTSMKLRHGQLPKDDGDWPVHLRVVFGEGSAGCDDSGGICFCLQD